MLPGLFHKRPQARRQTPPSQVPCSMEDVRRPEAASRTARDSRTNQNSSAAPLMVGIFLFCIASYHSHSKAVDNKQRIVAFLLSEAARLIAHRGYFPRRDKLGDANSSQERRCRACE